MGSDFDKEVWIVLVVWIERRSRMAMGCDTEMQPSYRFRGFMMLIVSNVTEVRVTVNEHLGHS